MALLSADQRPKRKRLTILGMVEFRSVSICSQHNPQVFLNAAVRVHGLAGYHRRGATKVS